MNDAASRPASQPAQVPQDRDAEAAVLGGILLDNNAFPLVAAQLESEHFYRPSHRIIFAAMATLYRRGEPIDLITLKASLGDELVDVGGPAALARLVDGRPRRQNVGAYAQIVRRRAEQRAILRDTEALARAVLVDDAEGLADQASVLASRVAALDTTPTGRHGAMVAEEVVREAARREARRRVDSLERPALVWPEILTLRDRLARPRPVRTHRIAGWLPRGTRAMLAAQYKAGKTSLVGNIARSLVDGDPFLGVAQVTPLAGSLALIDTEMNQEQLEEWLAAQHIREDDRIVLVPLRGAVSTFNLLDEATRAHWVVALRERRVECLVLDCLRPVLDALGLDESRDAGRFLTAFDALLHEAGIPEALVVQHMGHSNERARGDSRLRDWPDVEWRLVRQEESPSSPRFISAHGRDVDVAEAALEYEPTTRRLTLAGGSRRDAKLDAVLDAVLGVLDGSPLALSGRAVKGALRDSDHSRNDIEAALGYGLRQGRLTAEHGPRNARLYRPPSQCSSVSRDCPEDGPSECPAPSRERDTRTLDLTRSTVPLFDGRPT